MKNIRICITQTTCFDDTEIVDILRCNLLLQFLIRAINKPNLDLFETLIHLIAKYVSMYMSVYEGTLIIQLPRLNWQTKLLQKLGSKLH